MRRHSLVFILFCCGAMGWAGDLWKSPEAWRQLAKKMTESQVVELLGGPQEKETVEQFRVWYYQETPQRKDGQIVWRPKSGLVRFKKVAPEGQEVFLLLDWKPPRWENVELPAPEKKEMAVNPLEQTQQIGQADQNTLKEVGEPQGLSRPAAPSASAGQSAPKAPKPGWQERLDSAKQWFSTIPRKWLWIGGGIGAFVLFAIFKPSEPRRKKKKKEPQNPDLEM